MSTSETWSAARFALCTLVAVLLVASPFLAQTTISTGSIVGTVTDPSGAVVSAAKVTITNKATGQVITTTTTSTGTYASGALTPGAYQVRVEGQGFKTTELPVIVQVNTTASGNVKLEVGQSAQVVEVQGTEVTVNTEQATVQGVLTSEQIENLPINGRNFLDWHNLNLEFKFRMEGRSIRRRTGSRLFHLVGALVARPESKWMEWTSATRPWERLLRTFRWVRSKRVRCSSRHSISRPS